MEIFLDRVGHSGWPFDNDVEDAIRVLGFGLGDPLGIAPVG
jgi:hypothetical protein